MNQFLQIMNEDTENSQFGVDMCGYFLLFVFGEWWVVGGVFYNILLHVNLFFL